ncbi:hypothetical protein ABI57_22145 [Salmonella enterica subsp. enterica serovar Veneziana]|nr:hypothetical protein ABI57_22145 [Salmonella enterica subsp. enterica serovar Veneziana]
MKNEELAQLRYQEMCRIVGDVVFAMVAEGHETKRVAIADVIRTELAKGLDKWDGDQLQYMKLAVKLLEEQGSKNPARWPGRGLLLLAREDINQLAS